MAKKVNKRAVKELEQEGKLMRELLARDYDHDDELLVADGFDAAIIAVSEGVMEPVVCYNYDKCVEILITRDGMTEEDALEHMSFNVTGAYVGPRTPLFLRLL